MTEFGNGDFPANERCLIDLCVNCGANLSFQLRQRAGNQRTDGTFVHNQ